MSIDPGGPPQRHGAIDLWRLPEVQDVRIRHRHFDPPRRVTHMGVDREIRDAIEIEIRVSEPFVIRALSPVLWVGDEPLTIAEVGGKDVYRFFAFDPSALKPGATISLGWNSPKTQRKRTQFEYFPPSN
jgi:hypothetical protein